MVDNDIRIDKISIVIENPKRVDLKGYTKATEDSMENKEKGKQVAKPPTQIPRPLLLFPHRVKKKVEDGKFNKFLSMLKQLLVNVSLVEYPEQMRDMLSL